MDDRRRRFENIVMPHLDAAHNYARWLSRSTIEVEDIVQDAMLRAFRGFDRFRGDNAKPWLLAIVRNCYRTAAVQRKRQQNIALSDMAEDSLASDEPTPEMATIQALDGRKLNQAIAALSTEFRETLVLHAFEGLAYREIAQILDVPIGTVMSRLFRARMMLRESWLPAEKDPSA